MKSISTLLGFVVLATLCYGAYLTLSWLASSFADIDPNIGATIIAGATAVISSVYIASYNARKAKERAAMEAHRERKTEVYDEFMAVLIQVMRNTKAGKEGDDILPENLEEFFYKFTSKVVVYGAPGVVKAFGALERRKSSRQESRTVSVDGHAVARNARRLG